MNVAVIVVTYNNSAPTLAACLDALARQTLKPTRTLVIDNASPSGFPSEVLTRHPDVELVRNADNIGFAAANNQAFALLGRGAQHIELVALLNPDAFPEPEWLAQLVAAAAQFPDVAAFASRMMIDGSDRIVDGLGDVYHLSGLAWRAGHGLRLRDADLIGHEVFGVCAGAALYRLSAVRAVGGFDEDLFCYLEDVDLSFRLRRLGHRCRYVPDAVVWHVGGDSTRNNAAFRLYHGHRNMITVYLKNMPTALLLVTLPVHLFVNLLGVLRSVWRRDAGVVLRAKWDAIRRIPATLAKRGRLASAAVVGARGLWPYLDKSLWRRISTAHRSTGVQTPEAS